MENTKNIKVSQTDLDNDKQELIDCIHNLVGFFDTPIARKKINGDDVNEVRENARKILTKYGINYTGL
jgi:hypothetical protein